MTAEQCIFHYFQLPNLSVSSLNKTEFTIRMQREGGVEQSLIGTQIQGSLMYDRGVDCSEYPLIILIQTER